MYCLEAYLGNVYIKCNNYIEYEKVCMYLASKGITWVSGLDVDRRTLFVTDRYPIWLFRGRQANGVEGICWTDSIVKSGCKYYYDNVRKRNLVNVVECRKLGFA